MALQGGGEALQAGGDAQARAVPGKLHVVCRKTRLCKFDLLGTCSKGDACGWAHGRGELLPTPDLSRTKTCPSFLAQGRCDRAACRFAHGRGDLRRVRLRQARPGGPSPPPGGRAGAAAQCVGLDRQLSVSTAASEREPGTPPPRDRFLKTKLCAFFQRGSCSKQGLCSYAHSEDELNPLPNLLRTKMCKAAAAGQHCSNEGTCRFAHSDDELQRACRPSPCMVRLKSFVPGAEGVRVYADGAGAPAVLLSRAQLGAASAASHQVGLP